MTVSVSDRLADQITTALEQLRSARAQGEYERELTWQSMLDRLLDRWAQTVQNR